MAEKVKAEADRLNFFIQRYSNALRSSKLARDGVMPEAQRATREGAGSTTSHVRNVQDVVNALDELLSAKQVAGQVCAVAFAAVWCVRCCGASVCVVCARILSCC